MEKSEVYLNALIEGDSRKIKNLYAKNFSQVRNFIKQNKGGEKDAEDIFQKALLQIAIRYKKEAFIIKGSFDGYLFTVCKNLWRRELNKNKGKVANSLVIELLIEEKESTYSIIEQKRQELFIEKLGVISENCKKMLTLFFAKTPYSEIVVDLGYNSETVVRQRIFKCKKKLTELIKGDVRYNSLKEL